MTQPSLTEEQEAKLAAALEIAKIAEQKAKEMSAMAGAIAEKYQKRIYEAALAAKQKKGE
ncbi:hypothetical protein [Kamptonema formosum]|uniref:hypothetical protein n=1 Tax=Kamptonema formosum TaxID=331992 RepID=UPI000349A6C5|nr:hypothetical protein [Oscillatoria sp. PCC 10802]